MKSETPRVLVLGAGGHTGTFVVDLLKRKGAKPFPATRSGRFVGLDKMEESCAAIDFLRPASLDAALAGMDAVINCAGPFFDTAEPAVEAALRARIPYLDVTAEQMTALRLFERFDDRAKEAGIPVLPAMAFYGGLADLLASALAGGRSSVDAIEIAVGLDSWHPTSGTRLTGAQNTFERLIIREGRLAPVPTPPPSRSWSFPQLLGEQPVTCVALAEIILISRHIDARTVTSFMNLKPLADLQDAHTPPPRRCDATGRSAQHFFMDVRVEADGHSLQARASGRDIYAVTAPLVVNACLELLARGAKPGVRAPGEIFDARQFLDALAPDIEVRYGFEKTGFGSAYPANHGPVLSGNHEA